MTGGAYGTASAPLLVEREPDREALLLAARKAWVALREFGERGHAAAYLVLSEALGERNAEWEKPL